MLERQSNVGNLFQKDEEKQAVYSRKTKQIRQSIIESQSKVDKPFTKDKAK